MANQRVIFGNISWFWIQSGLGMKCARHHLVCIFIIARLDQMMMDIVRGVLILCLPTMWPLVICLVLVDTKQVQIYRWHQPNYSSIVRRYVY